MEEYYKLWKDTFDGVKQARLVELVEKFEKLSDTDKFYYFWYLVNDGTNDLEFAKFVSKRLKKLAWEATLRLYPDITDMNRSSNILLK